MGWLFRPLVSIRSHRAHSRATAATTTRQRTGMWPSCSHLHWQSHTPRTHASADTSRHDCRQFVCNAQCLSAMRCVVPVVVAPLGSARSLSPSLAYALLRSFYSLAPCTHTNRTPTRRQNGEKSRNNNSSSSRQAGILRLCARCFVSELARAVDGGAGSDAGRERGSGSLERIFELERRGQNNCVLDSLPCGSQAREL